MLRPALLLVLGLSALAYGFTNPLNLRKGQVAVYAPDVHDYQQMAAWPTLFQQGFDIFQITKIGGVGYPALLISCLDDPLPARDLKNLKLYLQTGGRVVLACGNSISLDIIQALGFDIQSNGYAGSNFRFNLHNGREFQGFANLPGESSPIYGSGGNIDLSILDFINNDNPQYCKFGLSNTCAVFQAPYGKGTVTLLAYDFVPTGSNRFDSEATPIKEWEVVLMESLFPGSDDSTKWVKTLPAPVPGVRVGLMSGSIIDMNDEYHNIRLMLEAVGHTIVDINLNGDPTTEQFLSLFNSVDAVFWDNVDGTFSAALSNAINQYVSNGGNLVATDWDGEFEILMQQLGFSNFETIDGYSYPYDENLDVDPAGPGRNYWGVRTEAAGHSIFANVKGPLKIWAGYYQAYPVSMELRFDRRCIFASPVDPTKCHVWRSPYGNGHITYLSWIVTDWYDSIAFTWPPPFNWVQLFDAAVRNAESPLVNPESILYPVSCPSDDSVFCRKIKSSLRYQLNTRYTQTSPLTINPAVQQNNGGGQVNE